MGDKTNSLKDRLEFFLDNAVNELRQIRSTLNCDYYNEAIQLIIEAEKRGNRIHVSGIGKPHHLGGYTASLLSSVGTPCYFLDGTEATHGSAGQVVPGDVVICISYYGNVPELMKTISTLKNNGAKIISVTGFPDSWIAREADVHLLAHVKQEGDSLNKPPRTSMLATLYVIMGLSLMLQEIKEITPEIYVKWHPSGQLGVLGNPEEK